MPKIDILSIPNHHMAIKMEDEILNDPSAYYWLKNLIKSTKEREVELFLCIRKNEVSGEFRYAMFISKAFLSAYNVISSITNTN